MCILSEGTHSTLYPSSVCLVLYNHMEIIANNTMCIEICLRIKYKSLKKIIHNMQCCNISNIQRTLLLRFPNDSKWCHRLALIRAMHPALEAIHQYFTGFPILPSCLTGQLILFGSAEKFHPRVVKEPLYAHYNFNAQRQSFLSNTNILLTKCQYVYSILNPKWCMK